MAIQAHSAQALELGLNETYGLGQNFGNRYIQSIQEIDAAAVQQAAKKYILPEAYIMVAVGAFSFDTEMEQEEKTLETDEEIEK